MAYGSERGKRAKKETTRMRRLMTRDGLKALRENVAHFKAERERKGLYWTLPDLIDDAMKNEPLPSCCFDYTADEIARRWGALIC